MKRFRLIGYAASFLVVLSADLAIAQTEVVPLVLSRSKDGVKATYSEYSGRAWSMYNYVWFNNPPRERFIEMTTVQIKETMPYYPDVSSLSIRNDIHDFFHELYKIDGIANHQQCGALCVHSSVDQMKGGVLANRAFRQRLEIRTLAVPIPDEKMLEVHLSLEGWYRRNGETDEETPLSEDFYRDLQTYGKAVLGDLVGYLKKKWADN